MTTILLIEDTSELADLICRELLDHGYEVHHAADGQQGLADCASLSPDLVILDWMLPKMDGLEVLRRLRSELNMLVPVLMLTARGDEVDRVIGLELGADDYVSKPFSMRELIARVRALVRRMERVELVLAADLRPQINRLQYRELLLEPDGYRATLSGKPLELSRTEFDLLTLLLRNPGRVFGRAYLLDTIWSERYVVGDRSVDNAILRLRRKLGAMGQQIETVWGVGYRLRGDVHG